MTFRDRFILQQVHPLKLWADVLGLLVGCVLIWNGATVVRAFDEEVRVWAFLAMGLLVAIGLPSIVSVLLLLMTDLAPLRATSVGRYVLIHTGGLSAIGRFIGVLVVLSGAWQGSLSVLFAGLGIIVFGWMYAIPSKMGPHMEHQG